MTKIIGFVCEWGGYAAADLAGFRKIHYPSCLRTIRVECTGRIDPAWLVDALVEGADGAIIIGCTEGDSRHEIGNFRAHERIRWIRKGLAMIGERPERARAVFISSEDAEGFAATIRALETELASYGPVTREGAGRERLEALREVFMSEKVRWLIGRTPDIVADGDVFGERVSAEAFDAKVEEVMRSEYRRALVLRSLRKEARSASDVASSLKLPSREVMSEITDLIGQGRVEIQGHADPPVFKEVSR
jgi:coenzyme F420-reducing hydrogenase delta subunit